MSRTAHNISGPPKKCSKCGELKELSEYGRDALALSGLKGTCKKCHNLQSRICIENTSLGLYKKDLLVKPTHSISGLPKKCARCGETKELPEYGRSKAARDGLKSSCKECRNLQNKACKENTKLGIYQQNPLNTIDPNTKVCVKCRCELPLTAFGVDLSAFKGRRSYCHKCEYIVSKESKSKTRRIFGAEHFDHLCRMRSLKSDFNITEQVFQELMNQQKGCCAICNTDFGGLNKRASVDHDHTTGEVRSLLCQKCNTMLGLAKDSSAVLLSAVTYLTNHAYTKNHLKPTNESTGKKIFGVEHFCHLHRMSCMKTKYGMSEADYQELMNQQKGCCAICEADFGSLDKRASVDHDHTTGLVRGLLCQNCNATLGHANDVIQVLFDAATYLKKFKVLAVA